MKTDILIKPSDSLSSAIKLLNETGYRCLLVITDEGILLGTLSDGDIRRSILENFKLDEPIENTYNKNSFFIYKNQLDQVDIHQIFLDKKFDLIPVIDTNKKIVDIIFFKDLYSNQEQINPARDDIVVIIMAGGLGSRLLPYTKDTPKPLIKIDSRPIIQIVIENFQKQGIRDFLISVNHMSDQIKAFLQDGKNFGVNIDYIHEEKPLGTCGSLSLIKDIKTSKNYIITNADILADMDISDLIQQHKDKNADITLCSKLYEVNIPYGVVKGNKFVKEIKEKPNEAFWINTGIYVLNPDIIKSLEYNAPKDMPEFIDDKIRESKKIAIYPMTGYWKDIGNIKELNLARERFKEKK